VDEREGIKAPRRRAISHAAASGRDCLPFAVAPTVDPRAEHFDRVRHQCVPAVEQIDDCARYLASDESSYVTSSEFTVDAGMT